MQHSEVAAVFTQPDRPAGRGRKLRYSPIKLAALELGMTVSQPEFMRGPQAHAILASCTPDFMVVAAYGQLLPQSILDIPKYGCLNIHASLLPRWRGAAPIQRAILNGDRELGVTIMQMSAGLDSGDMLHKAAIQASSDETAADVHARLAEMGAISLQEVLNQHQAGKLNPVKQDETQATYARKLDKSEAEIQWGQDAQSLHRMIRAFNSWPVAYTHYLGNMLRIWKALPMAASHNEIPGRIVASSRQGIDVATGAGLLRVEELQLAGRTRLKAAEFANAHSLEGLMLPN